IDAQVEVAVDGLVSAAGREGGDLDDGVPIHQKPTLRNRMAKMASSTITSVIEATTELGMALETLSVLGRARKPKWQAMRATTAPKLSAFSEAIQMFAEATAEGRDWKK